jgi:hypothetical protein
MRAAFTRLSPNDPIPDNGVPIQDAVARLVQLVETYPHSTGDMLIIMLAMWCDAYTEPGEDRDELLADLAPAIRGALAQFALDRLSDTIPAGTA